MTRRISRPLFAIALALGMIAAFSSPGRAALSTAERTSAPVAAPSAPEATTLAATAEAAPVRTPPAAAARVAVAAPVAATAPVAEKPRKKIVRKATPRRVAAAVPRAGYPCH